MISLKMNAGGTAKDKCKNVGNQGEPFWIEKSKTYIEVV